MSGRNQTRRGRPRAKRLLDRLLKLVDPGHGKPEGWTLRDLARALGTSLSTVAYLVCRENLAIGRRRKRIVSRQSAPPAFAWYREPRSAFSRGGPKEHPLPLSNGERKTL